MRDVNLCTFGLSDRLQQVREPGGVDVEGLATFNASELAGAQFIIFVFILANNAANAG